MLITKELPENYEYDLMNDFYKGKVLPQLKIIAEQIDNDIRICIKREIKERGSIIKRYGDWAKFINKEMGMAHYPIDPKYPYHQTLFYRGEHIRDYVLKFIS